MILRTVVVYCSLLMLGLSIAVWSREDAVWIDVRSELEHRIDHIEGDLRISHTTIVTEVEKLFPDKNTELLLYCRSGNRAEQAAQALRNAGYTQVKNVGGIDDARVLRTSKN